MTSTVQEVAVGVLANLAYSEAGQATVLALPELP